jgi:hypothetical protein
MRRALLLVVFAFLALTEVALAQTRPELTTRADALVVGVGDEVHVVFQAMSSGGMPSDPQIGATRGFTVTGMTSGPSQTISIINGHVTQKQGLSVTWTLRAERVGTGTIGPSVAVDGTRFTGTPVKVRVVVAGQAPQPTQPSSPFSSPLTPFDPFKSLFDTFGDQGLTPHEVAVDPKLALDAPLGTHAFLHATIDKASAVVGEQVTLNVLLYIDLSEREPDLTDVHEATADDFVKRPLFEDDTSAQSLGNALIGGRAWAVKLVRKEALFPLKTGDLEIGPMSLALVKSRMAGDPHRASETLHVHVTEPPVAGRPPGYTLGDVGNFTLSADVTPREIDQDGAVGITVDLSGTGNLPEKITPPARAGIEWLPPELHGKMGATPGDKFGGKRTFAFVVRLHRPGQIDLGELSLPFWNPDSHAYGVARATLGSVKVKPGAVPSTEEAQFDPFASMAAARAARAAPRAPQKHLADRPVFWLGLGAAPLTYALALGAWAAAGTVRRRRSERATSPETELRERMGAAERACTARDGKDAYAAIVRALETATIARAGVNVRDARNGEVAQRLGDIGVETGAAKRFEQLLRACETARFSAEAIDIQDVQGRWKEAKDAIATLKRAT